MKREQQASGADKAEAGSEARAKAKEGAPAPARTRQMLGLHGAAGNRAVAGRLAATRSTSVQRLLSDPLVVQRGNLEDSLRKLAESQNLNYDDLAQALVKMAASQGSLSGSGSGGSSTTSSTSKSAKNREETAKQKQADIDSLTKQIDAVKEGKSSEKVMTPDEQLDAQKARLQRQLKYYKDKQTKLRRNGGEVADDEESREARELAELDRQNDEAGYRRTISGRLNADERRAERTASLKEEAGDVDARVRARRKRSRDIKWAKRDADDQQLLREEDTQAYWTEKGQRNRATYKRTRDIRWAREDLNDTRRLGEENQLDTLTEERNRKKAALKRKRDIMFAQEDLNDPEMIQDQARLKMLQEDKQNKDQWALNQMKNQRDYQANFVQNNATANNPLLAQWANLKKKKK